MTRGSPSLAASCTSAIPSSPTSSY
jgi:hypothetical protein